MAINNSLSNRLCFLLALTCGFILANMYYAQSILTDIAVGIGVMSSDSGVIITLAQIGYCLGVLFLVPLGDKLENKRLILSMILVVILSLCLLGTVRYKPFFFIALVLLGIFCSSVQLIIPYASSVASENQRGKVVGIIITGAIFGIVLARPIASMITESFSWRYAFLIPAICMLIIALLLAIYLPKKYPEQNTLSYLTIFKSMLNMLFNTPTLKVQIIIMTLVFFCFTSFWATMPMILQNELGFTHRQIALFSLLSIVTPVCAFVAGRVADKGFALIAIVIGIFLIAMAFLITPTAGFCITSLVISVLLLDSGANITNVVIQQSVIVLNQQARSRLNALCITFTFGAGAMGSFLGPWLYNHFSWAINTYIGSTLMGIALMIIIVNHLYLKNKY